MKTNLNLIYAAITALFITGAIILLALGKDITALVGLLPVLITSIITLERVHKVEKNTNGNMTKLIEAALEQQRKLDPKDPTNDNQK